MEQSNPHKDALLKKRGEILGEVDVDASGSDLDLGRHPRRDFVRATDRAGARDGAGDDRRAEHER